MSDASENRRILRQQHRYASVVAGLYDRAAAAGLAPATATIGLDGVSVMPLGLFDPDIRSAFAAWVRLTGAYLMPDRFNDGFQELSARADVDGVPVVITARVWDEG